MTNSHDPAAIFQGLSEDFLADVQRLRNEHDEATSPEAQCEQQQECEVLQSIYEEAFAVVSQPGEAPLVIKLELPVELEESKLEVCISTPDGIIPVGEVTTVPPLVLVCALPGGYPLSSERPAIDFQAVHLGRSKIESLRASIDEASQDAPGEQVIFTWASLLQEQLRLPRQHVLRDEDLCELESSAMDVARSLLAHHLRQDDVRRMRELHRCLVCFDDILGERGVFLNCGHFGCKPCLTQMTKTYVAEAELAALRCPSTDCRSQFGDDVMRTLLGASSPEFARWSELSLQLCLDKMQDVAFCPRCDADADEKRVPCIIGEDNLAQCTFCFYAFCGRCKAAYHPGVDCDSMDTRMQSLEAAAAGRGAAAEAARMELQTLRHLAQTTKRCPRCETAIEKSEGCSKMTCRNCHIYFCWRCGKEITGYEHFVNSECKLFDNEEIRRWNQMPANRIDHRQARAHEARFLAQFADPGTSTYECPRCRIVNWREGRNNHIRCHACQTPFCAQCFTVLPKKGSSEHFKPKGLCPQHSDA